MTPRNARTRTLRKYIDDGNIRLSKYDREFLNDLARVGIIDEKDADAHHYDEKKTPAKRRLDRLCEAGVLEKTIVTQPGRGQFNAYQFKTDRVATLFGGKRPTIGRKRNALHEVITSKIYFAEGRPQTFVVESNFSREQKKMFELDTPALTGRNSSIPDAMYFTAGGEIVVVEADSGQYNKNQINSKQAAWKNYKQVWGQPDKAAARVTNAKVYRFE